MWYLFIFYSVYIHNLVYHEVYLCIHPFIVLKSKMDSVLHHLFLEYNAGLNFSWQTKQNKETNKNPKITLFVNDYWRWILLPIAIPRWGLMFPNGIMQNYSKVAFIWQKQHKFWIINNYWAQIACLSLILAQCTTAGKSHVPEAKFIGIRGIRRGNMKKI